MSIFIAFSLHLLQSRNRSFHGDEVIVRVHPETTWQPWSTMMSEKYQIEYDNEDLKSEDGGNVNKSAFSEEKYLGIVIFQN